MGAATLGVTKVDRDAITKLRAASRLTWIPVGFPSPFYPGKSLSDGTLIARWLALAARASLRTDFALLFSTCANEAGWNSDVIEQQLSHEERDDVRAAYNRA
jgi:hypothetical protein